MINSPFILFVATLLSSWSLFSAQVLNTSSRLNIEQSIGSISNSSDDSSINITTIRPGYSIDYQKRKMSLAIDYNLVASKDNENNKSDISHELDLNVIFQHIPNEWLTSYSADIFQKNKSDSDLLVSGTTISDANETYIVNSLETSRTIDLSNSSRLKTKIGVSAQGFKDQSTDKNALLSLQLNIQHILPSINFSTSLDSNRDLNDHESNDTLNITTYYIINPKLNSFLSITKNSSNNNKFDETRYSVGLDWRLSTKSHINFDIGKIGDEESWSIDSSVASRRATFTLNHSEKVAPANQNILFNLDNDNSNLASSINNDLKYIKNTSLTVNHRTRKLQSSLIFTKIEEFTDLGLTSNKSTRGKTISLQYTLNSSKSVSYSYSDDKITTFLDNRLKEHSVNWFSTLSRQSSYNLRLSHSEQTSDLAIFDYKKTQLDFNYTLIF